MLFLEDLAMLVDLVLVASVVGHNRTQLSLFSFLTEILDTLFASLECQTVDCCCLSRHSLKSIGLPSWEGEAVAEPSFCDTYVICLLGQFSTKSLGVRAGRFRGFRGFMDCCGGVSREC